MTLRTALLLAVPAILVSFCQSSYGQDQKSTQEEIRQLKQQMDVLRDEQLQMRKDLEQIKALLRRQAQASQVDVYRGKSVSTDVGSFKGEEGAKVTLLEFSDFQCPFCARFAQQTMPRLEEEYVKTGRVKFIFRDLPLERIHKSAFKAAEAAACAGEQGQFWAMHDVLFANNKNFSEETFDQLARQLNLDQEKFQACMLERKFKANVENDMQDAQQLSITGTPTFLIGLTQPGSAQMTVVRSLRGAVRYERLKQALDSVLEKQSN